MIIGLLIGAALGTVTGIVVKKSSDKKQVEHETAVKKMKEFDEKYPYQVEVLSKTAWSEEAWSTNACIFSFKNKELAKKFFLHYLKTDKIDKNWMLSISKEKDVHTEVRMPGLKVKSENKYSVKVDGVDKFEDIGIVEFNKQYSIKPEIKLYSADYEDWSGKESIGASIYKREGKMYLSDEDEIFK